MPIRIYALAKELKIDSKELVEVCTKAGITGKGSALASLTDEEVEKVKSYLQVENDPKRRLPFVPSRPGTDRARAVYAGGLHRSRRGPRSESKPAPPAVEKRRSPPKRDSGKKRQWKRRRKPPKAARQERTCRPCRRNPATPPPKTSPAKTDEPAPQKPIMTLPGGSDSQREIRQPRTAGAIHSPAGQETRSRATTRSEAGRGSAGDLIGTCRPRRRKR